MNSLRHQCEILSNDMCKDAIVCLLTGSDYNRAAEERLLFEYILAGNLEEQLWFFLKVASFNHQLSAFASESIGNYRRFTLQSLKVKVRQLGRDFFMKDSFSEEINCARYARILFFIGDYTNALNELIYSDFIVESAVLGIALQELGLVGNKN